jgi:hypothetical protein
MHTKNILSWLLLLFGEALIITAFILFGGNTPANILVMNIGVSSLVYALFFCNFRAPWINLQDKTQKQIGALGISWLTTWVYALMAIGFMLIANLAYEFAFIIQLIVHSALLFFLGLWSLLSQYAADKAALLYYEQTDHKRDLVNMKKAMKALKDTIDNTADLPESFVQKVQALEERLRFIAPSENAEAHDLERSFVQTIVAIYLALPDYSLNKEQIESDLKKCERLYQNRKNIYSN